jgi:hypothetical protein
MPWQLHTSDRLRADYGPDRLLPYAEGLHAILDRNQMAMPHFPEMVWVKRHLSDGVEVAVGIAQDRDDLLAYVWPADKIEFVGTEEVVINPPEDGGEGPAITLYWYGSRD